MARIAFVGLGRMGSGMAGRLLDAGHDVVVHNRTPERGVPLVERGARWAGTPGEAAEGADAVFVMVSDDEASRAVWQGPDGVLAGDPAARAFAIECSTLSYGWVVELAAAARNCGLRYVDAPVTGLPDAAAAGRLTLLLGADGGDLDEVGPLLDPLADHRWHFGPVGAGTTYKLLVNLMGAVQIAATAEMMAAAERAGLDLDQVARAIASGQAASPQVVRNAWRMAGGDHDRDVVFTGRLRHKDASYGVRLAQLLGTDAPLGRAALASLDQLLADGLGDQNESAVVQVARTAGTPPSSPPA